MPTDDLVVEWLDLAEKGQIEDAVVAYVRHNDWVTYVELENRFAAFCEVKGSYSVSPADDENTIIWANMAETWCKLLSKLRQEGRIFWHPSSAFVYMIDGGYLPLPIAKKPPKGGYKTLHWLPVCLRVVPLVPKSKK